MPTPLRVATGRQASWRRVQSCLLVESLARSRLVSSQQPDFPQPNLLPCGEWQKNQTKVRFPAQAPWFVRADVEGEPWSGSFVIYSAWWAAHTCQQVSPPSPIMLEHPAWTSGGRCLYSPGSIDSHGMRFHRFPWREKLLSYS